MLSALGCTDSSRLHYLAASDYRTFIGTHGEAGHSITIERSLLEPYGYLRAAI